MEKTGQAHDAEHGSEMPRMKSGAFLTGSQKSSLRKEGQAARKKDRRGGTNLQTVHRAYMIPPLLRGILILAKGYQT